MELSGASAGIRVNVVSCGEHSDLGNVHWLHHNSGLVEFSRYHELVTKYGKLEPLAVVDLRPQSSAKVEVHFQDKVEEMSIRLDQTVAELKKHLKTVVQLSTSNMLLFYLDQEAPFGPEEMKYSSRALHSYGIRDGDKIYVEPRMK